MTSYLFRSHGRNVLLDRGEAVVDDLSLELVEGST